MVKKSSLFYTDRYKGIERKTRDFLNGYGDFLSESTARSTRAFGDAVEGILGEHFREIIGAECAEYSATFARRSMADIAFKDKDDFYYVVDVKTHRADTVFNMPNLISVERLARFYEDDANYFTLLLLRYTLTGIHATIFDVIFAPIEFLDWECLTIGALGWGQIQIANSNRICLRPQYSRKQWMLELCDILFEFYPREITKIQTRLKYFERLREYWEQKRD
jgi:hypothetical protein